MAKDDPPSGLLSKVARFVANPTKSWDEVEGKDSVPSTGYSKDVLKAMIVRKKQNDFVRKREFDVLRKLRRTEPAHNEAKADRPSYFQSSLPSNADDRAMTVRKIDEIEAQMSNQWWRGKSSEGAAGGERPPAPPPRLQDVHSRPPVAPVSVPPANPAFTPTSAPASSPRRPQSQSLDLNVNKALAPAQPVSAPRPEHVYKQAAPTAHAPLMSASLAPKPAASSGLIEPPPQWGKAQGAATDMGSLGAGFSISNIFQNAEVDVASEPELEEASIRFANGDNAGAEEALLTALKPSDLQAERAEIWIAALFDLYRATGQQARFDESAIEFAGRFGRSAPAWFSTPEVLKRAEAAPNFKGNVPSVAVSTTAAHWTAPAVLTPVSLTELQLVLKNTPAPWLLDWGNLVAIEIVAVAQLGLLFAHWCVTPVTLGFRGSDGLQRALQALTTPGDTTHAPAVWQMHMDALRVMGMHDDFETVALDFCITFEVSPPSWQKSLCICKLEGAATATARSANDQTMDVKEPWKDSIVHSSFLEEDSVIGAAMVALSGEILSDAAEALAQLEAAMGEGATQMVVSCDNLIRVDFSAAGSILNWVAGQRASGCMVQFRNVNRIVAAFFHVIGITEFARVVPRNT
jgi:ABC-type transporter Mla MlaB component